MEPHRALTFAGAALLAATLFLNSSHGGGSDYAYVTGAAMLGALGAGLALFTWKRLQD